MRENSSAVTRMMTRSTSRIALFALVLFLCGPALAQFNASLSGTVQDSTGAIIPGASVTLTNPATQQVQ
jgi:p-aminobenzoyl-glutamate transporter AbgT